MTWTRQIDLRAQVQKLWDRGELLASYVTGQPLFPQRLGLKVPTSAEMTDRFDEVRSWIGDIKATSRCRVEMREFKHRVFGANSIPAEVWIDNLDDAVAFIGKRREFALFISLIEVTNKRQPKLLGWLAKRPLRGLELIDEWSRLLDVVAWLQTHPRPGMYIRQVDIPGVDSKFIEAHRGVFKELFDLALPPEAINTTASGVNQFATRYGFRDKPMRIRFRVLDPDRKLIPDVLEVDITLDADSFSRLNPDVENIFITENEINFLAFPQVKNSLVIFGEGYGFEMLSAAKWLARCRIYYWGDIDTHGFAILDQLRNRFDHVESLLMNRKTLLEFKTLWGQEPKQTVRDLPRLNSDERNLYDDLRDNRIRKNLRLEQEGISFGWIQSTLDGLQSGWMRLDR